MPELVKSGANGGSQQRRKQRAEDPSAAQAAEVLRLVEAVVEEGGDGAGREVLRVELPGGARVEIGGGRQVALAAALLRALGGEGVSC